MNIKENYQQYVSRYASEVAALKRKNTGFITGELLAFGGILAFLICYFALNLSLAILFNTVFLIELINTAIGSCRLLLASVE